MKKNIPDGTRVLDKYKNWVPEKNIVVREPIQVNSRWKWVIEQQISRWPPPQWTTTLSSVLEFTCADWPTSTSHLDTLGGREGEASCTQIPVDLGRVLNPDILLSSKRQRRYLGENQKWRREKRRRSWTPPSEARSPTFPTRFHLSSYDRDGDELKGAGPRVKKVFHQQLRQEVFVDTTFLFNSLTIPLQSKFFFHVILISCQKAITYQGTQNRTPEIQTSLTKSFSNGCILDLTLK